jgi:hypothetical protein
MSGDDFLCFNTENVLRQIDGVEPDLGVYKLRFYASNGRPSREPTDSVLEFLYYPSGGTIRDSGLNILHYEPRLDRYHPSNRG